MRSQPKVVRLRSKSFYIKVLEQKGSTLWEDRKTLQTKPYTCLYTLHKPQYSVHPTGETGVTDLDTAPHRTSRPCARYSNMRAAARCSREPRRWPRRAGEGRRSTKLKKHSAQRLALPINWTACHALVSGVSDVISRRSILH